MVAANKKFSKEGVSGGSPPAQDGSRTPFQKAAEAVKNAVGKFDPHATVTPGPDTLKVKASYNLRGKQGDLNELGTQWQSGMLSAVNNCLSAQGLAGAGIEHTRGKVNYGPGIGVPMDERAFWSTSFTVQLPL